MASAVLMQHQHQQNYNFTPMGKLPFPNNLNHHPNNNSSLSHLKPHSTKPNKNNKKQTQPQPPPPVIVDATSFTNQNQESENFPNKPSFSTYININLSTFTKPELKSLRSRLISELHLVRSLSSRIQTFNPKKRKSPSPPNPTTAGPTLTYVAPPHMMLACRKVLTRILKTKSSSWFKQPVDVVGLGLHDYYSIVKKPMDLGTVKRKIEEGGYNNPEEFADDVRLTFENAVLYNPIGHVVHAAAKAFLEKFDGYFSHLWEEYLAEKDVWLKQQMPVVSVEAEAPVDVPEVRGMKMPKPKAKDPNKREMSMEEKHKLGAGLQSLPEEKMSQVIGIIRKRNGHLAQDGDEIELDIEAIDKETLWELDRFVTNYKKMVSKMKRQSLMGFPGNIMNNDDQNDNLDNHEMVVDEVGGSERVMEVAATTTGGKVKKGGGGGGDVVVGGGEEDVDIGDEMPVHNFPSLVIEKDDDNRQQQGGGGGGGNDSDSESSSSSSSSDDSSSSDSDSGSSSGSDSDVDDAQSRDNESKNIHH